MHELFGLSWQEWSAIAMLVTFFWGLFQYTIKSTVRGEFERHREIEAQEREKTTDAINGVTNRVSTIEGIVRGHDTEIETLKDFAVSRISIDKK